MDILRSIIYFLIAAAVSLGLTIFFTTNFIQIYKITLSYNAPIYAYLLLPSLYSIPYMPVSSNALEVINEYGRYRIVNSPNDLVNNITSITVKAYIETTGNIRRVIVKKYKVSLHPIFIRITLDKQSKEFVIAPQDYNNYVKNFPTYCFPDYYNNQFEVVCVTAKVTLQELPENG